VERASRESIETVETSYFGIPLVGKTIGYVIDADATMAPYIEEVAYVTNWVNETALMGSRRFGIVMGVSLDGARIVEVAEPSADLEGARAVLLGRIPGGKTDLNRALAVTGNWYADQLFLVLSKPLDEGERDLLAQSVAQTGAVTHVIALGDAARQDLSPIARASGGTFMSVTDGQLDRLVQTHAAATDAKKQASPS
jgi:hypothetical protein